LRRVEPSESSEYTSTLDRGRRRSPGRRRRDRAAGCWTPSTAKRRCWWRPPAGARGDPSGKSVESFRKAILFAVLQCVWYGRGQLLSDLKTSLHCRLAKCRGSMNNVEYGPVIGWENPITWIFGLGPHKSMLFPANHRAVFCIDHQTTEFRQ